MRPVRLELNGFAWFRDHTVVDFLDADYFALVGPTGSGKSTILDAITFALYGSAYRWGRSNAIAYALTPTTNRCTVSLTFDVGADRYQVAREVRRVGSGGNIQQKAVSLVRFADPNAIVIDPDGPQPETLAGEIKELSAAIEELLGLEFDDFCQCVVLPQGEFARFLTAGARDRQQILLKLLGADQYEAIGKRAGARAARAADEVHILTEQLDTHAEATPEAEAAARERHTRLGNLADIIDRLAPGITTAQQQATSAAATVARLKDETDLLAAIATPDGVEELQQQTTRAQEHCREAEQELESATNAFGKASDTEDSGPQRPVLEVARSHYSERDKLRGRRSEVEAAARRTAGEAQAAETAREAARETVATARETVEAKAKQLRTHQEGLDSLAGRLRLLESVQRPADVDDLTARAVAVTEQANAAAIEVERAQERHTATSEALAQATDARILERARLELDDLDETLTGLESAAEAWKAALTHENQSAAKVQAAEKLLEAQTAALEVAQTRAGAAQLRPQLQVGHDCPVCEQTVTTLPPPLTDPQLDQARAAQQEAATAHKRALREHKNAEQAAHTQKAALDRLTERASGIDARLTDLLPDRPAGEQRDVAADLAYVGELATTRETLVAAEAAARSGLETATLAQRRATAAQADLESDLGKARGVIHTLLGSLTALEPPTVEVTDLSGAWAKLQDWATGQAATLTGQLAAAEQDVAHAQQQVDQARTRLRAAEAEETEAQRRHTTAVGAAHEAATEQKSLTDRLGELDVALANAPDPSDLPGLFAECERNEAAVAAARARLDQAREQTKRAMATRDGWNAKADAAGKQLLAARDTVGAMTPPTVDVNDLVTGWDTLTTWARLGCEERARETTQVVEDQQAATSDVDRLTRQVETLLLEHGLDPSGLGDGADRGLKAPLLVTRAVAAALHDVEKITTRLAEAEALREKIDDARARQQVAAELAGLLRSNKFPQWLAEAALDTLVAGASESLRILSSNQFDLAHKKGEFYVIDHADADSIRSVRTLSGGETFQASLALALALSEQLSGMGGATQLESIFLDEGFGTLDPDTLETVAGTLENLAQGERMVGVITHVAALAERAPVRYQVHRDSRTSTITREGAA